MGVGVLVNWYLVSSYCLRSPLSHFSVAERVSWAANCETFRQEDKAYSLLGIFDVNMPLIYSEGKDKAMQRLREEIEEASKGTSFSSVIRACPK